MDVDEGMSRAGADFAGLVACKKALSTCSLTRNSSATCTAVECTVKHDTMIESPRPQFELWLCPLECASGQDWTGPLIAAILTDALRRQRPHRAAAS